MARNSNRLLVPGAREALDKLKTEIAEEMGIELGADTASRLNGIVGGEMVRRLVLAAQEQLSKKPDSGNFK